VDFEWLKGKISPLLDVSEELKSISPGIYYEAGEWSVIKLIALGILSISTQPSFLGSLSSIR